MAQIIISDERDAEHFSEPFDSDRPYANSWWWSETPDLVWIEDIYPSMQGAPLASINSYLGTMFSFGLGEFVDGFAGSKVVATRPADTAFISDVPALWEQEASTQGWDPQWELDWKIPYVVPEGSQAGYLRLDDTDVKVLYEPLIEIVTTTERVNVGSSRRPVWQDRVVEKQMQTGVTVYEIEFALSEEYRGQWGDTYEFEVEAERWVFGEGLTISDNWSSLTGALTGVQFADADFRWRDIPTPTPTDTATTTSGSGSYIWLENNSAEFQEILLDIDMEFLKDSSGFWQGPSGSDPLVIADADNGTLLTINDPFTGSSAWLGMYNTDWLFADANPDWVGATSPKWEYLFSADYVTKTSWLASDSSLSALDTSADHRGGSDLWEVSGDDEIWVQASELDPRSWWQDPDHPNPNTWDQFIFVYAGAGQDTVYGSETREIIDGGKGSDVLYGSWSTSSGEPVSGAPDIFIVNESDQVYSTSYLAQADQATAGPDSLLDSLTPFRFSETDPWKMSVAIFDASGTGSSSYVLNENAGIDLLIAAGKMSGAYEHAGSQFPGYYTMPWGASPTIRILNDQGVDLAANLFTKEDHGLETGYFLQYEPEDFGPSDLVPIGGLVDGRTYYVEAVSDSQFALYEVDAQAADLKGARVDLTSFEPANVAHNFEINYVQSRGEDWVSFQDLRDGGEQGWALWAEWAKDRYLTDDLDLTGNDQTQIILGNDGANRLSGLGGDDELFGLEGDDVLDGGDGNDVLLAGAGNDTVIGGAGDDVMLMNIGTLLDARNLHGFDIELSATGGHDYFQGGSGYDVLNVVLRNVKASDGTYIALEDVSIDGLTVTTTLTEDGRAFYDFLVDRYGEQTVQSVWSVNTQTWTSSESTRISQVEAVYSTAAEFTFELIDRSNAVQPTWFVEEGEFDAEAQYRLTDYNTRPGSGFSSEYAVGLRSAQTDSAMYQWGAFKPHTIEDYYGDQVLDFDVPAGVLAVEWDEWGGPHIPITQSFSALQTRSLLGFGEVSQDFYQSWEPSEDNVFVVAYHGGIDEIDGLLGSRVVDEGPLAWLSWAGTVVEDGVDVPNSSVFMLTPTAGWVNGASGSMTLLASPDADGDTMLFIDASQAGQFGVLPVLESDAWSLTWENPGNSYGSTEIQFKNLYAENGKLFSSTWVGDISVAPLFWEPILLTGTSWSLSESTGDDGVSTQVQINETSLPLAYQGMQALLDRYDVLGSSSISQWIQVESEGEKQVFLVDISSSAAGGLTLEFAPSDYATVHQTEYFTNAQIDFGVWFERGLYYPSHQFVFDNEMILDATGFAQQSLGLQTPSASGIIWWDWWDSAQGGDSPNTELIQYVMDNPGLTFTYVNDSASGPDKTPDLTGLVDGQTYRLVHDAWWGNPEGRVGVIASSDTIAYESVSPPGILDSRQFLVDMTDVGLMDSIDRFVFIDTRNNSAIGAENIPFGSTINGMIPDLRDGLLGLSLELSFEAINANGAISSSTVSGIDYAQDKIYLKSHGLESGDQIYFGDALDLVARSSSPGMAMGGAMAGPLYIQVVNDDWIEVYSSAMYVWDPVDEINRYEIDPLSKVQFEAPVETYVINNPRSAVTNPWGFVPNQYEPAPDSIAVTFDAKSIQQITEQYPYVAFSPSNNATYELTQESADSWTAWDYIAFTINSSQASQIRSDLESDGSFSSWINDWSFWDESSNTNWDGQTSADITFEFNFFNYLETKYFYDDGNATTDNLRIETYIVNDEIYSTLLDWGIIRNTGWLDVLEVPESGDPNDAGTYPFPGLFVVGDYSGQYDSSYLPGLTESNDAYFYTLSVDLPSVAFEEIARYNHNQFTVNGTNEGSVDVKLGNQLSYSHNLSANFVLNAPSQGNWALISSELNHAGLSFNAYETDLGEQGGSLNLGFEGLYRSAEVINSDQEDNFSFELYYVDEAIFEALDSAGIFTKYDAESSVGYVKQWDIFEDHNPAVFVSSAIGINAELIATGVEFYAEGFDLSPFELYELNQFSLDEPWSTFLTFDQLASGIIESSPEFEFLGVAYDDLRLTSLDAIQIDGENVRLVSTFDFYSGTSSGDVIRIDEMVFKGETSEGGVSEGGNVDYGISLGTDGVENKGPVDDPNFITVAAEELVRVETAREKAGAGALEPWYLDGDTGNDLYEINLITGLGSDGKDYSGVRIELSDAGGIDTLNVLVNNQAVLPTWSNDLAKLEVMAFGGSTADPAASDTDTTIPFQGASVYVFNGMGGEDSLLGTEQEDLFYIEGANRSTEEIWGSQSDPSGTVASGGGGNDIFSYYSNQDPIWSAINSSISGGAGVDILAVNGDSLGSTQLDWDLTGIQLDSVEQLGLSWFPHASSLTVRLTGSQWSSFDSIVLEGSNNISNLNVIVDDVQLEVTELSEKAIGVQQEIWSFFDSYEKIPVIGSGQTNDFLSVSPAQVPPSTQSLSIESGAIEKLLLDSASIAQVDEDGLDTTFGTGREYWIGSVQEDDETDAVIGVGGAGDDVLLQVAGREVHQFGGAGDDLIYVNASQGSSASGGEGFNTLVLMPTTVASSSPSTDGDSAIHVPTQSAWLSYEDAKEGAYAEVYLAAGIGILYETDASGEDQLLGVDMLESQVLGQGWANVVGTSGDDLLNGDKGANQLVGGAGDDRLYGGLTLIEDASVGEVIDVLSGGQGNDRFIVSSNSKAMTVIEEASDLSGGTDDRVLIDLSASKIDQLVSSWEGGTVLGIKAVGNTDNADTEDDQVVTNLFKVENRFSVERIGFSEDLFSASEPQVEYHRLAYGAGSSQSEIILTGKSGNAFFVGGGGQDIMLDASFDDIYVGGSSTDLMYALMGRDRVIAGGGDDDIYVGLGRDNRDIVLTGQGKDTVHIQLSEENAASPMLTWAADTTAEQRYLDIAEQALAFDEVSKVFDFKTDSDRIEIHFDGEHPIVDIHADTSTGIISVKDADSNIYSVVQITSMIGVADPTAFLNQVHIEGFTQDTTLTQFVNQSEQWG